MTYQRRNRVLCLHGPTQSAASFRAALKSVCDALPRNWEFHFLDAPFIIADEDDASTSASSSKDESARWCQAAIDASLAVGLEAELSNAKGRRAGTSKDGTSLEAELSAARQRLDSTKEGKRTWEAQEQLGGADAVEALLSTKVVKSMSRGWSVRRSNGEHAGIDVGLNMIGDYMREQGTFHAVIGCDSGGSLAILLQTLLSYPRSSTQAFPSYFAQLPKGVKRMPRMGGWEEEPPAPDDPRLGDENLTKDYVPVQKPFEAVVAMQMTGEEQKESTVTIGTRAAEWTQSKRPILQSSDGGFAIHSVAFKPSGSDNTSSGSPSMEVVQSCSPTEDLFDAARTAYLASWLKLAVASCAGDGSARQQLFTLQPSAVPRASL